VVCTAPTVAFRAASARRGTVVRQTHRMAVQEIVGGDGMGLFEIGCSSGYAVVGTNSCL
jgi:hypothetical protein